MSRWRDDVAFLNLTTFAGIAPGASHWYASIEFREERTDLTHVISARESAAMNKSDSRWDREAGWSPGDRTSRYRSKEDAIRVAREGWREIAPDAKILIEGSSGYAEPQPVLDGLPVEIMDELNALFQRCEDLGWWDDGRIDQVKKISEEWFGTLAGALKEEVGG